MKTINAATLKWTRKNQLHGLKQGWILTNNSEDRLTISRVDDPLAWEEHETLELMPYDEPMFECDDLAAGFVVYEASTGDRTAQKALRMVGLPAGGL